MMSADQVGDKNRVEIEVGMDNRLIDGFSA
jgi:hypothetical protein